MVNKGWMFVCAAASVVVASEASAAQLHEGVVVQTSPTEVVVDVGTRDGLTPRAEVWIYRRLTVTHPVTKKEIEDRFPIGSLVLDQVGERLSISKGWAGLSREPKPGDFVVFVPPERPQKKRPRVPAESGAEPEKPAGTPALERAFRDTLGRSIPDRIEIWKSFLQEHPDGDHTGQVLDELRWLRVTEEQSRAAQQRAVESGELQPLTDTPDPGRADASAFAPRKVESGMPIPITVVASQPENVDRVRLHVRRAGAPVYSEADLKPAGSNAWATQLDPAVWRDAGEIEYFAEVIRTDGEVERVDKAGAPTSVAVEAPPSDPRGRQDRSEARIVSEYVNFKAGEGTDEYARFEAKYRYDIGIPVLRGFTAGVGMFRGEGAPTDAIAAGEPSTASLLSYGFAETDFEFFEYFGVNTRLLLGNNQQLGRDDSVFRNAFGMSGELRFGQARSTRLLLGAAFTETVGAEAWIQLYIDAIDRVPMSGEVVVTNLPVGADLGVSLNYEAGYAFTDWFTLMGRVGWNARTITHHGPTAGLSTVFSW